MGKVLKCSECPNRVFINSCNLRRHYKNYHPNLEPPSNPLISKELEVSECNDKTPVEYICGECSAKFSFKFNLVKHINKFHSTDTSTSLPIPKFKCMACGAEYISKRCLKRHEHSKHSRPRSESAAAVISKKYKCSECGAAYTNSCNLKRHERLKHSITGVKKFTMINCSLCATSFFTQKDDLFKHWEFEHGINIETEDLEFENADIFLAWKNNVENDTRAKFVRSIPGFSSKTGETMYYHCNRSGYFNSRSKGLRHLKTQGTCKINSICPARMKVKVLESGKHLIKFTKTHVGHEHDLGHLSLSKYQRQILASKIASNVSFDKILDEIKESIESDYIYGRIHLLTRKDLHNIKQSYNLIPNAANEEDASLECAVEETTSMEESSANQVDFLEESSETPTSYNFSEETSVDDLKKRVNDYYQKLTDSANTYEELEVISNLLQKAKPLMEAVRQNNNE